jgi:elongation factor G
VFFCSIEPESLSAQKALDDALGLLRKEDPSFSVSLDPETGQTLLSAMGELHLEILKYPSAHPPPQHSLATPHL